MRANHYDCLINKMKKVKVYSLEDRIQWAERAEAKLASTRIRIDGLLRLPDVLSRFSVDDLYCIMRVIVDSKDVMACAWTCVKWRACVLKYQNLLIKPSSEFVAVCNVLQPNLSIFEPHVKMACNKRRLFFTLMPFAQNFWIKFLQQAVDSQGIVAAAFDRNNTVGEVQLYHIIPGLDFGVNITLTTDFGFNYMNMNFGPGQFPIRFVRQVNVSALVAKKEKSIFNFHLETIQ